jgi:2-polyprenyl-6-methoxyphenol hydroxylase-like FAD-dependent oxidoreductase
MRGTAGIIGAGIGGLATAIMLERSGWRVTVLERSAGPLSTGTALGMWPEALRALDTLGVGEEVRRRGARQRAGAFLRPDGSRIATIDVATLARRLGDAVHLVSRPTLLDLLRRQLPPDTVEFGREITDPAELRAGYDVVVAADGISSRIRAALFPGFGTRYAGCTAWRGTVDGATDTVSETWGAGQRFGITPRDDGRTNWYATAVTPAGGRSPAGELAVLRNRFGDWHPAVRRVLDSTREEDILRHDLYDLDRPLPTFVDGTVALIGDAAHAMTPDLGRGACEALLDAVALGECLVDAPDARHGLARYDQRRRKPVQRLARISRTVGRLGNVRRFVPVRDAVLRAALALGPT